VISAAFWAAIAALNTRSSDCAMIWLNTAFTGVVWKWVNPETGAERVSTEFYGESANG
jgi:hypothetical protein